MITNLTSLLMTNFLVFRFKLVWKVNNSNMAFNHNGRLVVSEQDKAGTFIIDLPPVGETLQENMIKKLPLESSRRGMLFAFDHL